jgi:hypothetical protein
LEPSPSLPAGTFAFAVFGDGPYRSWEVGRFRRLIKDVNQSDLAWLIHVGDIFWYPCSDENVQHSLAAMNSFQLPVVYTPGDNEWADCYEDIAGRYAPLERLRYLRRVFFADPEQSLGGHTMPVASQSSDSSFAEFVENQRWVRGGFVFATVHMVGSDNAGQAFVGRKHADDEATARRIAAALAWMDQAFAIANHDSLHGVVIAMHGSPGLQYHPKPRMGYEAFLDHLEAHVKQFGRPVLLIHGDGHTYRVDHPLRDRATYEPLPNFTRLETLGSPDIGWVRVVVDSVAGDFVAFEPRQMRRWWLW